MELTLQIESGDGAGRRIPVPPGPMLRFGRLASADVRLSDDPTLSGEHFGVRCDDRGGLVTDLGSRFGTLINGAKVVEGPIRDGDEIRAGRTVFTVCLIGAPPDTRQDATHTRAAPTGTVVAVPLAAEEPPPAAAQSPAKAAALAHLRRMPGALYALLDAACEPTVPGRLDRAGLEYESLYEGGRGDVLAPFGPWLVRLPTGAALLDELVRDGWGASWALYLTCDAALPDVRRHLRKFLIVKLADGRQVYFRYYDPRVLRTYLPTCTAAEVAEFVGPVRRYACESVDGSELLEFAAAYRDWNKVSLGASQ